MSEKEYRAHPAIAQSTLKLLDRSPAHARWAMNHPKEPTDAMQIGTCLHALVLEGRTDFVVLPAAAGGNSAAAKAIKAGFIMENPGKIILSHSDAEKVGAMALGVERCKTAMKMLSLVTEPEKAIFWEESGIQFKALLDAPLALGVMDLKSTMDASLEEFERSIYKYGYHIQAAHYLAGAAANGLPCENFYFLPVESSAPNCARVLMLDHGAIEVGEKERQRLISVYKKCLITGEWPGYPDEIQSVTLPFWAFKKQMEENDYE